MTTKKAAKKNKLRKEKKPAPITTNLAGGPGAPPKPPQG
jgi:hypothetical protein